MSSATVQIEKLVYGGEGLARQDGQVVLVPFVLPGEQVEITTARVKNGLLRGLSPQVLQSSPERVVPQCEYFGSCGGCHYQHAEYAFQLVSKTSILRETLSRLAGIKFDSEIAVISGEPWNYRNRIQLHFAGGAGGFHKADSHDLCDITHCEISSPVLNEVIRALEKAVKQPQWPSFLRSLEVFTNEREVQLTVTDTTRPMAARFFEWCGSFLPPLAPGALDYEAAGHTFQISRGAFFQVNRFLTDQLVHEVVDQHEGDAAADLYAGVGLFTLPLAQRFKTLYAVERGGPAFRDLEANAQRAGVNVQCTKGSAEEFLRNQTETLDLIVADPPRAGLGPEATTQILRIQPARLVIVSCDAATLARDLKILLSAYKLERLALVDLFPQTYHFETVVHLTRANS